MKDGIILLTQEGCDAHDLASAGDHHFVGRADGLAFEFKSSDIGGIVAAFMCS